MSISHRDNITDDECPEADEGRVAPLRTPAKKKKKKKNSQVESRT